MKTQGIFIKQARYANDYFLTVLDAEFTLWSIKDQRDYTYRVWVNPNNDGSSSIKMFARTESGWDWVEIFRGSFDDCRKKIEEILSAEYHWTYIEFSCYVSGYCDAMRRVESDGSRKRD